jgi:hypothetical protein
MRSASTGRRVRDEFISAGLTDEGQVVLAERSRCVRWATRGVNGMSKSRKNAPRTLAELPLDCVHFPHWIVGLYVRPARGEGHGPR